MTQAKPFNYERPDWGPLERAVQAAGLPQQACGEFMWMAEFTEGAHSYKHRETRGYVVLASNTDIETAASRVRKARCGWQYSAVA